jgi:copper transport protein
MAVGLIAGLWLVFTSPAAHAHALVRRSNPADGAVLEKAPDSVLITFTEAPDPNLSIVHVLDSTGRAIEKGKAQAVPGAPLELRIPLGPLGKGVYTVTWRTVSKVDGHVTGGSFSFGVGVAPGGVGGGSTVPPPSTPSPSPLGAGGRWAFYWGLAVLTSAAALAFLVFRDRLPAGGPALLTSAWALSALGLAAMFVAEHSSVGVSFGRLLTSSAGRGLLWQGIALAAAGVTIVLTVIRPGKRSSLVLGAAAAATLLLHARASHAAAGGWFEIGVQWVHLLAVAVWIGGLLWLLLGVRGTESPERGQLVRRFSWLAGIALAAVAVTGLLRALNEVGGPSEWRRLIDTSFGVALLVKVGLFGGLVALGALNRYVNVPGVAGGTRPTATLRRTVGVELVLAAGILGVTGVLTQLPPASSVASEARPPTQQRVVVNGNDFATSLRVRLVVTPGAVGPNSFAAQVTDFDTRRPVDATRVSLRFSLPSRPELGTPALDLSKVRSGLWAGRGTVISMDGQWNISVLVQSPSASVEVPLTFTPRLPPQQIKVSRVPGQPTLYTIALDGGASLQAYVDPGTAGDNVVHFTFFNSAGNEEPIASASATAVAPTGSAEILPLVRFDSGHFVSNTKLDSGHWRFRIQATNREGTVYDAYFEQHIP